MNLMLFSEWISKKYTEWRGDAIGNDRSVTQFALMLGVAQPALTAWMNGEYIPKSQKNINKIAAHYPEVYDVLGISKPAEVGTAHVPRGLRQLIRDAQEEVERRLRERNLTGSEPEALEIATQVFHEFGFTWSDTIQPGKDE